jgi:hypothetical protein
MYRVQVLGIILVIISIPGEIHGWECPLDVYCTTAGPPLWRYSVYSPFGPANINFFQFYKTGCVLTASASYGFDGWVGWDFVSFSAYDPPDCGTTIAFALQGDTNSINGTVHWSSMYFSGTVDGPVCAGTPTPTGFPIPPTSTPTLAPVNLPSQTSYILLILLGISLMFLFPSPSGSG